MAHYCNGKPKCACGVEFIEFLSIDHVDGGGTAHRKEIKNLYSWLKRSGYPPGYRVLCHNCNQSIGAYGYSPAQEPGKAIQCAPLTPRQITDQKVLEAAAVIQQRGDYASIPVIAAMLNKSQGMISKARKRLRLAGQWPHKIEEKFRNK